MSDTGTRKIATIGCYFFRDSSNEIVIQFLFMHNGDPNNITLKPQKRIFLSTSLLKDFLKEIPTIPLQDNVTILANADIFDYALTYNLSINSEQRAINVKLVDAPNVGETFITQGETDGITIYY